MNRFLFSGWKHSPSGAEISRNLFHPAALIHMERTAGVAMSAANTVGSLFLQVGVVILCQHIPCPGQVIILVNQSHIQPCRTWSTVIAVYADSFRILRSESSKNGIVFLLGRSLQIAEDTFQVLPIPYTWQHGQNAWLIQGILDALVLRQRRVERRRLRI